ncbi:hypothetical protein MHY87_04620 [Microvirga sp. ACRRW]|uniref:hypothetical protein n=1 Tax=Microvirga sp. ACRRW TaxID=2918205 RepID=UPI001EF745C2|nr:hypothetical protein [Microvirga sp. ACRRW]MCG7392184.1 hypothetical protein [Microvirga sp. ACRRW]
MPDKHHEAEAEKILAALAKKDQAAALQTRLLLAQALEQAEQRGREMFANLKESSG